MSKSRTEAWTEGQQWTPRTQWSVQRKQHGPESVSKTKVGKSKQRRHPKFNFLLSHMHTLAYTPHTHTHTAQTKNMSIA